LHSSNELAELAEEMKKLQRARIEEFKRLNKGREQILTNIATGKK